MPTVYNKVTAGGSTLIDLSSDTVTSASHIMSGYVGHLADGTQVTGTGSGGSSDLIVTLSKNVSTGYWEPDKTWSEVSAAITNNEKIIACINGMTPNTEISAECYVSVGILGYIVYETIEDQSGEYYTTESWFSFSDSGVLLNNVFTYYDTYNADATASDILSGKVAFNSSGKVIGSIATKTSSDLNVSGAAITAPAGYYASSASASVSSGSATTPATTITANPSISVSSGGLITATASASQNVTPTVSAGYVSSGTAGTITVSGSNTSQLTVQAAQTIHPSNSDQTISSDKYLTGTQTFKAVALTNLSADNIKSGVTVKVGDSTDDDCVTSVTGTYSGGGAQYKTGTYTPSSTYSSVGNREITTLANIGFTPKKFVLYPTNRTNVSGTSGALLYALSDTDSTVRLSMRYSNSSGSLGRDGVLTSWTTQTNGYLYNNGTSVYFRTSTSYYLIGSVQYTWEAFG